VSKRCGPRVFTLSADQAKYIIDRLLAARKRFSRIVARIRAGKPPKERARKPRKPRPAKPRRVTLAELEREFAAELPRGWRRRARADRARVRAEERAARAAAKAARPVPMWRTLRMHLPGWICAAAPAIYQLPDSAAGHIHELRRLLADPEMQALLRQSRYLGDSLKRICRGLAMDLSVLYPAPEVATAPVAVAPEPEIASLGKTDSATPPAAAKSATDENDSLLSPEPAVAAALVVATSEIAVPTPAATPPSVERGAPGENLFFGAPTPCPPVVDGGIPSPRRSLGVAGGQDFFAPD
jgi:hypothetical protein